jgi:hypothetical protein
MAQFIAGNLYATVANPVLKYGTNKSTVATNTQSANEPQVIWACKSVSKTFVVFKDHENTVRRLRKRSDILGNFVYPFGRFAGAPVLRAEYTIGKDTNSGQQ